MEVRPYQTYDEEAVGALDPAISRAMALHAGVIPASRFVASERGRIYGAGYLLNGPGAFVHLEFAVNARRRLGVAAAESLFQTLIERFEALETDWLSDRAGVLRIWCREKDRAYRAFVESFGFTAKDRMKRMRRTFQKYPPSVRTGDFTIAPFSLKDDRDLDRYLASTAEAYGTEDPADEMDFRLNHCDGVLYALKPAEEEFPAAFLTTWPAGKGVAATENILTRKPYRRRGYATALIEYAGAALREEGFKEATLNVYENDIEAIRLYESLGYRETDTLLEYHYRTEPAKTPSP